MSGDPHNNGNEGQDGFAGFESIVAEYEAALLRYATRILNNINTAQDVVQSTFLKLFKHWTPETQPSPRLSAWLYRVTHNGAVDHLRKESRRRVLLLRHTEEQQCLKQNSDGELSEAATRAAKALTKLSLRERQLVILKVYEEKSYREMSEISGLTEGNVGYILHHAMKKLATLVAASQDEAGVT